VKRIRHLLGDLAGKAQQGLARANRRLGGVPFLLKRTFDAYNAHDGTFISAAMAYYFFFTLFPLVLALTAIGSFFVETEEARQSAIEFAARTLPVFEETIARNIDLVLDQRGTIGILATLGLIYAASGLFGMLLTVVNRTWACRGARPSYIQRLLAIALVVVLALLFFAIATATTTFEAMIGTGIVAALGAQATATLYTALSLVLSIIVTSGALLILYWKLPATTVRFADAWPAALAAGVAWEGVRQLYAWYLSRFVDFTLVYGSLAAIIGLLSWFYLTGFIILLGAELSAQIAEDRGRGPSVC
jgi:membrane protein